MVILEPLLWGACRFRKSRHQLLIGLRLFSFTFSWLEKAGVCHCSCKPHKGWNPVLVLVSAKVQNHKCHDKKRHLWNGKASSNITVVSCHPRALSDEDAGGNNIPFRGAEVRMKMWLWRERFQSCPGRRLQAEAMVQVLQLPQALSEFPSQHELETSQNQANSPGKVDL